VTIDSYLETNDDDDREGNGAIKKVKRRVVPSWTMVGHWVATGAPTVTQWNETRDDKEPRDVDKKSSKVSGWIWRSKEEKENRPYNIRARTRRDRIKGKCRLKGSPGHLSAPCQISTSNATILKFSAWIWNPEIKFFFGGQRTLGKYEMSKMESTYSKSGKCVQWWAIMTLVVVDEKARKRTTCSIDE